MKRRTWKYLFLLLLLAVVAWLGSGSFPNERQPLAPVETLIAQETNSGWRLARPPELPGPYRRGENPLYVSRGVVGSVTYASPDGPVSIKLPVRDDVEQMAVPLRTANGAVALVVLER